MLFDPNNTGKSTILSAIDRGIITTDTGKTAAGNYVLTTHYPYFEVDFERYFRAAGMEYRSLGRKEELKIIEMLGS